MFLNDKCVNTFENEIVQDVIDTSILNYFSKNWPQEIQI